METIYTRVQSLSRRINRVKISRNWQVIGSSNDSLDIIQDPGRDRFYLGKLVSRVDSTRRSWDTGKKRISLFFLLFLTGCSRHFFFYARIVEVNRSIFRTCFFFKNFIFFFRRNYVSGDSLGNGSFLVMRIRVSKNGRR